MKQINRLDAFPVFDKLAKEITALACDADVSWVTAIAALQLAMVTVVLNVQCAHCRRQFVEGGFVETLAARGFLAASSL
jgi:hypothetical protein